MNVYDFDKTIYDGNSTIDFFFFVLKRDWTLLRFWPVIILAFFLYFFRAIDKTRFVQWFYSFYKGVKDMDKEVDAFWKTHDKKLKRWFVEKGETPDLVISASPEFLLAPMCQKLNIPHLIASKVDPRNGKYVGMHCFSFEKLRRMKEAFPNVQVKEFYSDSQTDEPIAAIAEDPYIIDGNEVIPWDEYRPDFIHRFHRSFWNRGWLYYFVLFSIFFFLYFLIRHGNPFYWVKVLV